ncbi:LuxR C-terminal-related transcriptional regulator [Novosphingobium album (ex Hu et al. 2023)]|uniref:Response regulator transcription factor n=1 Tax=Novosphingobium album (ex Hu et al. 2023) TaxID=2930093 RepID=A0ABT0B408_9SPHN|nr:response regulator transcription factor [Novosphingobium album (ex Hu et al. 2023)]MCJ2179781.1 response regulator transcription factor [Novosphingobium album (ex Hu et al. 2023)]
MALILSTEGFNVVGSYDDATSLSFDQFAEGSLFLIESTEPEKVPGLVERLIAECPRAVVVLLVSDFVLQDMLNCFRAGIRGYIVKSLKAAPLIAAIKLAVSGQRVLPPDVLSLLETENKLVPSLPDAVHEVDDANLSPREHDVLCCLMAGYSNKVIARELDVCEATVKVHVKAILRKLNVDNRTQAAIWASSRKNATTFLPKQPSQFTPPAARAN